MDKRKTIKAIFAAIRAVMGVTKDDLLSTRRTTELCFARMIATHHLHEAGLKVINICALTNAAPATVRYRLKGYDTEMTRYFVRCAGDVKEILTTQI